MIIPPKIPANGPAREALRAKGQFWTPAWVAEAMVAYVTADGGTEIFDPAVGAGAFFQAAQQSKRDLSLRGCELDATALIQAEQNGLSKQDLQSVDLRDFVLDPPQVKLPAIVANPPYIRHHRLDAQTKAKLKHFATCFTGLNLDGRAGYHIFFLLRALQLLQKNGRLAFLMPADTCEGIFAPRLWQWIASQFSLEGVVTFAHCATPFPDVDTNTLIFLIKNAPPNKHFWWAKCLCNETPKLTEWLGSDLKAKVPENEIEIHFRPLAEGLATGFSRPPQTEPKTRWSLGDFAKVLRGVATGANEFFFLTEQSVRDLHLPKEAFIRAVGRTRDVEGDKIAFADLARLDANGRPTFLLNLNGASSESLPTPLQDYLRQGEKSGLPQRPLIATRRPWYKMEERKPPPLLFAYLGRRNARFILNQAGVVPLTGFLCVYPRSRSTDLMKLWRVLNHPQTVANLALVGKSYGGGAIKVEPRALENLPLPDNVVAEAGLDVPKEEVFAQLQLDLVVTNATMI